ncbi:hypothetical protein N431DRAFT_438400 [Stipitochalara longipes BDJ]|nr:hypothetical protein N431DRAFT_438400 [Stipitochalara longipes BDJ]
MSRKKSSSFSFTKFFDAVIPNMFDDVSVSKTARLAPHRRDMLYAHQLSSQNFYALDERSFSVSGVVDSERVSKRTCKALQKYGVLREDGRLDTTQIGPKFIHQMSFLDIYRQKELVNLLFWWQEECQRYAKLVDEDKELSDLIKEAEQHAAEDTDDVTRKEALDQVKFAREWVRMKVRQRPSQRRAHTEANSLDAMEAARRTVSAPLASQQSSAVRAKDEPPPSYGIVGKG